MFLVLSGIYMAFMVYTMSMFQWEVPVIAKIVLLGLMLIVAGFRVLLIGLKKLKVWIGVAICAIYGGVFYVSDNSNFLFLAACTIGFLEIDYNMVIRTYLIAVGISLVIVVIAALTGMIDNLTFDKGGHTRYSMGTIYPTDFASMVLFLLMYSWVALKRTHDWTLLILPVISFVTAWMVAYSITSMICSVLFFAMILYYMVDMNIISKHPRIRVISDWATSLAVIIFVGAMICLLLLYENGGTQIRRIDELMSYRLRYASAGLHAYGLHPFGTQFEMNGAGGTIATGKWSAEYNFIDCSYFMILIRYGYLLLLSVIAIWIAGIRNNQKAGERRLALVMVLIALHSVSEHHMIEMHYNIALAMPLAAYGIPKQN